MATDVGAVVIAVDEIDVGVAGRSEENGVAWGQAAVGVGAGIDGAEVGFGFDDASGEEFPALPEDGGCGSPRGDSARLAADEKLAQELAGDQAGSRE